MPRVPPVAAGELTPSVREAFEKHVKEYNGRITNMKATLGHSLTAFEVYMGWYPLYRNVEKILGSRLAYLYAHAISEAAECPLCTTFFRKKIIDSGEDPQKLALDSLQKDILYFGSAIARRQGNINDWVYNKVAEHFSKAEMIILVAFAGQMIATNIFNNVVETDIDKYLADYLPPVKYSR
jgi:alkylhydroperoxidase family enzyme